MVPTCSSGTLTNVLPHWNAMQQTQDITPHPFTVHVYWLFYPLMWNVTLKYTIGRASLSELFKIKLD